MTMHGNRDFILEAVKQNGDALQFASEELRGDRDMVKAAVWDCENAVRYVRWYSTQ